MNILSRLNAFTYASRRRSCLGVTLATWIVFLLLFVALWARLAGWSSWIGNGALLLAAVIVIGVWLLSRSGYTRFVPDESLTLDPEFAAPLDENRVPLRATGIFSVQNYENYVLEEEAQYWRVPVGHHVIMVQNGPDQYLYQIVEPQHIRAVTPGFLHFGPAPREAIAVRFAVTWGPDIEDEPSPFPGAAPPEERPPAEERTVYFTFDNDADRHAVWRSFVQPQRV